MFSDRNVADIFPTPLFSYQVEDNDGFNAYVLDFIETVRKEEGWDEASLAGKEETLEHLQSADQLHHRKDAKRFVNVGMAATYEVLDFLRYKFDDVQMTSFWFNVSRPGYSHRNHVHPNNILSGVYYLKTSPDCGDIVFDDPRPQANVLLPDAKEVTTFNSHSYSVTPEAGQLVMFPSWLAHRVAVNRSKSERISLSFNVMIRGEYGFNRAYS